MILKPTLRRRQTGLTLTEVLVAIAILLVLAVLFLVAGLRGVRQKEFSWECERNLGDVGVCFRMWAQDHQGHFPGSASVKNGGWEELLRNPDQGSNCWKCFASLAHDFATPAGLFCPFDERKRATEFLTNGNSLDSNVTYFRDNSNLSFFIGISAESNAPNSILAGDRNLGPGAKPGDDFGFSPANGSGNDVAIPTTGTAFWSSKMHFTAKSGGVGNILFGDGHVQKTSNTGPMSWLRNAPPTTNWPAGHVPSSPSIRLVFP